MTALLFITIVATAQNGIGAWAEHLPYGRTVAVAPTPSGIWYATPYALFKTDAATLEVQRFWRGTGLSETGVSTIAYDSVANKLYVAYSNSNIDVISPEKITALPALKRAALAGDKTIYHFLPAGTVCYASTGIGVVVINAQKTEVQEQWPMGSTGAPLRTYMLARNAGYIYAATDEGLKSTPVNNPTPADYRTWQILSGRNGLSNAICKAVVTLTDKVFALQNDTVFMQTSNDWRAIFANGQKLTNISASENVITVCSEQGGTGQIAVLNKEGGLIKTYSQSAALLSPRQAVFNKSILWVADATAGASRWAGSAETRIRPTSPADIVLGSMQVYNGTLWATAGAVNGSWQYTFNPNGIYKFNAGTWTNYNGFTTPQLVNKFDYNTVAVHPQTEDAWVGSFGSGLAQIKKDGSVTTYNSAPLGAAIGDPGSVRVSGLAFDGAGNLWVSNYGAAQNFHVRKSDGVWRSFPVPFTIFENALADIVIDDRDQKWIIAPKGGGLICYSQGASIDATNDDRWRLFKWGRGNGGLPGSEILSIAKDRNNLIWVGTNDGIAVMQCTDDPFAPNCEATLPVIKGSSFANYLFKGEPVQSIAVDAADRKWIGTTNGLFLINAEGDGVLQHYTEESSFLLSNDVSNIAIDGATGVVYVATAKGLCSLQGEATEGAEEKASLVVYPNPVPPGYTGTIGIKGLKQASSVIITESNGKLVFRTTTLGGQAAWNGRNVQGQPVGSGVYLIFVVDEAGVEKESGKIIFIAR